MAQVIPLSQEETAKTGFTHKITFTYVDLAAETSGASFEIFPKWSQSTTFTAGHRVTDCALDVETVFTGGSISALVGIIGDGGDTARYMASSSIFTAAIPFQGPPAKMPYVYSAADTIDAVFTATGAALSALTQGKAHLYLAIHDLARLR